MNIEEKAKAYDEAVEKVKPLYKQAKEGNYPILLTYEYLFPELAESEDERIRRDIIHYILYKADGVSEEQEHSWIDYLERQNDANKEYWRGYREGKQEILDKYAEIEEQKDASKAIEAVERIDKYIDAHTANAHDMDDSNPDKKYYQGRNDALGKIAGILQDVYSDEKQKDQQPAEWSEEEEKHLYNAIEAVKSVYDVSAGSSGAQCIEFLKSIPERFNLSPKQEWSEEDERMRNNTILSLQSLLDEAINDDFIKGVKNEISWLKSLRPPLKDREMKLKILKYLSTRCSSLEFEEVEDYLNNLRPQPHWKPSEEQMQALEHFIRSWGESGTMSPENPILCAAKSLLNDLKKL